MVFFLGGGQIVRGYSNFQSDLVIAQRCQSDSIYSDRRTRYTVASAPICLAGDGYGPNELWRRITSQKSEQISYWGPPPRKKPPIMLCGDSIVWHSVKRISHFYGSELRTRGPQDYSYTRCLRPAAARARAVILCERVPRPATAL